MNGKQLIGATAAVAFGLWLGMDLIAWQSEPLAKSAPLPKDHSEASATALGGRGREAPSVALQASPAFQEAPKISKTIVFKDSVNERALSEKDARRLRSFRARLYQARLVYERAPGCVKPKRVLIKSSKDNGPRESAAPGWEISGVALDVSGANCSPDQKRLALRALRDQPEQDALARSEAGLAAERFEGALYKELWSAGQGEGVEAQTLISSMASDHRSRALAQRETLARMIEGLPAALNDKRFTDANERYESRQAYQAMADRLDEELAPGAIEKNMRASWAGWREWASWKNTSGEAGVQESSSEDSAD